MHRELVERRRWISEERFLHALNYCMLLPGPEAMQLATYVGWLLHRTRGAIVAGAFFILPSLFLLLGLSYLYAEHRDTTWVAALFSGLRPGVLAIVVHAVVRLAGRTLRRPLHVTLAAIAFVALAVFEIPFPAVVLGAGLIGMLLSRDTPGRTESVFSSDIAAVGAEVAARGAVASTPEAARGGSPWRALIILAVGLLLWLAPFLLLASVPGVGGVLRRQALFFTQAALVTFGGAYAVLPYIAEAAVEHFDWLSAQQMIDGLGLAETTPGPLIMVVCFVGFMAAWNAATGIAPLPAGVLGGVVATYFTFLPSFLFILLGAPFVEVLRRKSHLAGALAAITAAVVGVILNLAVFFGSHVLLPGGELDAFALLLTVAAFAALAVRAPLVLVVVGSAAVGLVYHGLLRA